MPPSKKKTRKSISKPSSAKRKKSKRKSPKAKTAMGRKSRYTINQVADALRSCGGLQYVAAQKLGCHASQVTRYVQANEELQEALDECVESNLDMTEAALLTNIKKGREASIFFYLKCKGKHRGYVEQPQRHEVEVKVKVEEVRERFLDELERIASRKGPSETIQ